MITRLHFAKLLLALSALLLPSAAMAADGLRLRVLNYNVRAGSLTTLDDLAAFINSQQADFVALQEVDVMTSRRNAPAMNGKNMVAELAARTGMLGYFGRTIDFAGGYYGIAILSKYPCVTVETVNLPNPCATEPRVFLRGVADIDSAHRVAFASVHLDVKSPQTRLLQSEFITGKFLSDSIPTIIGGDFNAKPGECCIELFNRYMDDVSGSELTFPADNPDRKIDYIFVAPKSSVTVIDSRVVDQSVQLSDHRAVVSDFVLEF